jgi:uncharacterized membrane protein YdcZ (DUF606 family)
MIYSLILPLFVGSLTVLQNTLNKDVAARLSLQLSLLVNNLFVLALSVVLFITLAMVPPASLPDIFRPKGGFADFQWRYLATGLCGFLFITFTPWAVERAGAVRVFIGIVVAQIVVSMLWDYYAESLPLSTNRVLGALLALGGALLASR